MRTFKTHPIGIAQGDEQIFADFENDGEMWTGHGTRERRHPVVFDEAFRSSPAVQVGISLWDVDTSAAVRAEVIAENITSDGFEIVFRTWADSRVARVRVAWTAIGDVTTDDDWDVP
ncbi:H-type lectin domain-containing protein [Tropicibacter sp. Alg240-R139]|uniref:H-type lectin domain-containing protein n=1 Tax=Tropicibacter sp. Alg240-R139 TaxID=2305991 RepID=UPI0013E09EC4|nr:H-type lectin domain-containing protein [Tropicibacter sp. Alg240-R139]